MKARFESVAPTMNRETVHIDNSNVFLRTFTAAAGCEVVNVTVVGASLKNKVERERLRALAQELTRLVDRAETML
jgi:hypothetical protein